MVKWEQLQPNSSKHKCGILDFPLDDAMDKKVCSIFCNLTSGRGTFSGAG